MKLTWKNKKIKRTVTATSPSLPFEQQQHDHAQQNLRTNKNDVVPELEENITGTSEEALASDDSQIQQLSDQFLAQGNNFAEDGKYREALGKWETAIGLTPDRAVLHEQKAQALLEVGDAWNALKAATRRLACPGAPKYHSSARATELDPSWAEAWITLGRAQLNFGEPDTAVQSFDKAMDIKPDTKDARDDRQTAMHLVKKRKQLHSTGLSYTENRYFVGDKAESS